MDWYGSQGFIGSVGQVKWVAIVGLAKMSCCICLFAAECLGTTAKILFRWDVESGGLIGVENRFFVWRDGMQGSGNLRGE